MTESARDLLAGQGLARLDDVVVIPHGAPDELFDARDTQSARDRFGVPADVPVMTTFGLLSEGKGIELALEAMSALRFEHPDLH
jgi:glycosyltransferase involved in cell wall biosynthesis